MDRIFLGPAMSRIKTYDEEIDKEKEVIRGDLRLLSYRDRILSEEKAFRPLYLVKEKTSEEITAAFLKKLELLAGESSINLVKVNPAESKQKKSHVEYYASLDCEGKLEDMAKFMYAVDTSPELLKIVQLKVGAKKAGSEDIAANMTIVKIIVDSTLAQESEDLAKKVIDFGTPGGASKNPSPPQKAGDGLGGQSGVPAGQKDGTKAAVSSAGGASVSQRFSMKTVKTDAKPVKQEEADEIKPSLWEKFVQKTFKGKVAPEEPTSGEEEPAAAEEQPK